MGSDGVVMNHRHGSRSVSKGVKRPAEVPGSDKRCPKRPKTVDVKQSSSSGTSTVLHPHELLSLDDSLHGASTVMQPIASSAVKITSLRDTVTSNGATTVEAVASIGSKNLPFLGAVSNNVLPTLSAGPVQSGNRGPKVVDHEKIGSTSKEGNQASERANGTTDSSLTVQSHVCCQDFEKKNGNGWLNLANFFKRLFSMGAMALLLFEVYWSSSFNPFSPLDKKAFSFSNLTMTEMNEVKLDSTLQRAPRRPSSQASTSRNLLAFDKYENLKSTLGMVKKELASAMKDLEKSRNDAVEAREEASKSRKHYEGVVFELEQTKNKLMKNQHQLNLAFQKLNHTQEELIDTRKRITALKADNQRRNQIASQELSHIQEELEQTRKICTISEIELKATLKELDAAHVTIDDLHQLLQVQESVAALALNVVATTALNRHSDEMHRLLQVHETIAAQALNFVVTMALNSRYNETADSKEKGHYATHVRP